MGFKNRINRALDLSKLTVSEKDGLVHLLLTQVEDLKRENAALAVRVSDLGGRSDCSACSAVPVKAA